MSSSCSPVSRVHHLIGSWLYGSRNILAVDQECWLARRPTSSFVVCGSASASSSRPRPSSPRGDSAISRDLTTSAYMTYALYVTSVTATEARKQLGRRLQPGGRGPLARPFAIERGGDERGLLIGFDEVRLLLAPYRVLDGGLLRAGRREHLAPGASRSTGGGQRSRTAQADLVEEVNAYVEEFLADAPLYLRSPNRSAHFPWVLRAYVAERSGRADRRVVRSPRRTSPGLLPPR